MEDLKILQKIYDMTKYGYSALAQFPKSEKFALVADIKHCLHHKIMLPMKSQYAILKVIAAQVIIKIEGNIYKIALKDRLYPERILNYG